MPVAGRKTLVDDHHGWIDVNHDRKAETDLHPGAVGPEWPIDEIAELCEIDDLIESALASRHLRPKTLTYGFSRPVRYR
jgi:hypothetical protein